MRMWLAFFVIFLLATISVAATTAPDAQRLPAQSINAKLASRTLDECFKAAMKRSEIISTQDELITQAEERYRQAKGGLFPVVNGVGTYLLQASPSGNVSSTVSPSEQTTVKVNATQPLFRGFREYGAILRSNLQVTAQIAAKRQAAVSLYSDVVQNFYTVLTLEQDLRNIQNQIEVDRKRIVELDARVRIGRSRASEVLSVKSAIATLEAQAETTSGQLLAARDAFAFLTGFDKATPITEAEDVKLDQPGPLPDYLNRVEVRPDVRSARDSLAAVEKNVTIARGGHLPSVDLSGDYFFKRPGAASSQNWDVLVTGTLPIFAGGVVNSQVREAVSQTRQSELGLARTRRLADQEIRALYDGFSADLGQIKKLELAAKAANDNYIAQTHDYKLGLVANIDVLQAIQASEESKRALDRAVFQAKLDFIRLEAAIAKRPCLTEGGGAC